MYAVCVRILESGLVYAVEIFLRCGDGKAPAIAGNCASTGDVNRVFFELHHSIIPKRSVIFNVSQFQAAV